MGRVRLGTMGGDVARVVSDGSSEQMLVESGQIESSGMRCWTSWVRLGAVGEDVGRVWSD